MRGASRTRTIVPCNPGYVCILRRGSTLRHARGCTRDVTTLLGSGRPTVLLLTTAGHNGTLTTQLDIRLGTTLIGSTATISVISNRVYTRRQVCNKLTFTRRGVGDPLTVVALTPNIRRPYADSASRRYPARAMPCITPHRRVLYHRHHTGTTDDISLDGTGHIININHNLTTRSSLGVIRRLTTILGTRINYSHPVTRNRG